MNMENVKRGLKAGETKKSHGMKSVFVMLIAFAMVFTMVMPAWAFAEDGEPGSKTNATGNGEVLMDETAEDADSPDDSDTFDGEETAEGAPEADASEDDSDGGETLSEDSSDEEDSANSNAETEPEKGQEDSGLSLNKEYPLTLTENISVTMRTHVFRSDYRQYVAIKVKNNSSETVEGGKKVTMKMIGTFKKDKLTKTEMVAEFSDKDTAKKACDEAKKSDKNVKCSGKKISQTTKVSKDEATSKEDFKKLAEGFMGFKCN